jgi:hypothetical protein
MSKDIKTLGKKFKNKALIEAENSKLVEENVALKATVTKLLKKIEQLSDIDPDNIIRRGYTPEQEIVEVQIERLQAVSRTRTLSLDETRTLDLHLKNKRLIDTKMKEVIEAEFQDLSEDDLMGLLEDGKDKETKSKGKGKKASKKTS